MLKKLTLVFFTLVLAFRCDFYDLEINEDPNNPLSTTTDLLLPSIQIGWASDYQSFHNTAGGIMGHTSNSDGLSFSQTSFDGLWNSIYLGEGADLDEYIKSAAARNEAGQYLTPGALGIGEVMKAFIFTTMVDMFGDVPFTESSLGNDNANVNPVYDDEEAIYTACLALIDSAVVHFAASSSDPLGDLIYGGNMASWTKAANSLKLKVLMNARYAPSFTYGTGVSSEIDLLFADAANLLITDNADNFEFQYNTNQDQGQRHPWTGSVYSGDNSFSYISHQLMYEMLINRDPRIPYYFHRQSYSILDQDDPTQKNTTPCSQNSACIYGYMALNDDVLQEFSSAGVTQGPYSTLASYISGFFGRDKGDPSGIPLDGALRLAPGIYPMGGNFDDGTPSQITNATGLGYGDGFTHFITAPMVQMYKMEHLFEKGSTGSMEAELELFIRLSMDLVNSVAASVTADAPVITSDLSVTTHHEYLNSPYYGTDQAGDEDVTAGYLGEALARYTASGDPRSAVFKEVWYSMWGSGVELYNSHRRSGYPKMKTSQSSTRGIADIQYPTFRATSTAAGQRDFPTIFNYPLGEFNLNSSFPEGGELRNSDSGATVFWDISAFKYN
jgi:hypothetical protein